MDFIQLKEDDVVVQNGATSAVGLSVIQIAKARGIKTVNIIRNRTNFSQVKQELMDLGATVVLPDDMVRDKEYVKKAMTEAGLHDKEIRLALNCVSGQSTMDLCKFLTPNSGATIVTYGGMSKKPVTVGTGAFIFNDITLKGFWVTRWFKEHHKSVERQVMHSYIFHLIAEGKLKIPVTKCLVQTRSDIQTAVDLVNTAQRGAKVLLYFPPDTATTDGSSGDSNNNSTGGDASNGSSGNGSSSGSNTN
uniref:Putative trans-2-enoyl-CoA reductase, mitochondrial n=1 Tax=Lygus hesperus TaxID=30085 RepID=A0A0A9WYW5_LYGHE